MNGLQHLPSGGALHLPPDAAPSQPVLFLHGVGGGAWSFEPQRAARSHLRCYGWDQRGHGSAHPVADAGLADAYQDASEALAAVLASAGQPVVLVGHSMGGLLAMALACEQPTAVRGVFLIDPVYAETGTPPTVLPGPLLKVMRVVMGALARSFARDGWLSRGLSRLIFKRAFTGREAMEQAWTRQRTQVPLEHPRMLFEALEGVRGFPFRPFAAEVSVPTFLLEAASGGASRFASLVERLGQRLGPGFTFDSVRGGHYLQLDRPAEVTRRLLEFARRAGGA